MNIPSNILKSSLLALVIFWSVIISKEGDADLIPFIMLSFIPIFLCVAIVIVGTICTIFLLATNEDCPPKYVFKTYFPYYAICIFSICALAIIGSEFDVYVIAFFASAFISTCQSWVWFGRENYPMNLTKK